MNEFIILFILIILSAFFSGAEVALVSVSYVKAKTLFKEKKKGSSTLLKLKENFRKTIITILIGNNIVNIASASFATVTAINYFGSAGLGIATGVMTLIILVFGEITPKTFASNHAEKISLIIAKPIQILGYILYPFIIIFEQFSIFIGKIIKIKKSEALTETEIKTMLEFGVEKKVIEPEEKVIMERAFKFSDITAYDAMTPIKNLFSLNSNLTVKNSIDKILKSGYSRIPIYSRKKNNIIGTVFIKDVFEEFQNKNYNKKLNEMLNEPIIVSKSIGIDDLLKIFQNKQYHIALVKDKENIIGLVTLEDLIEELVGEITDESDITPNTIIRIDKNTIIVHGKTYITKINKFFKSTLPTKNTEIQKLIKKLGKPKINSKIRIGELILIIENIKENEIEKIRIIKETTTKNL